MRIILIIFLIIPAYLFAQSEMEKVREISISAHNAVLDAVDRFRAECAKDGGNLELDGGEISKLYTDQAEIAYVVQAAFICNDQRV